MCFESLKWWNLKLDKRGKLVVSNFLHLPMLTDRTYAGARVTSKLSDKHHPPAKTRIISVSWIYANHLSHIFSVASQLDLKPSPRQLLNPVKPESADVVRIVVVDVIDDGFDSFRKYKWDSWLVLINLKKT